MIMTNITIKMINKQNNDTHELLWPSPEALDRDREKQKQLRECAHPPTDPPRRVQNKHIVIQ